MDHYLIDIIKSILKHENEMGHIESKPVARIGVGTPEPCIWDTDSIELAQFLYLFSAS